MDLEASSSTDDCDKPCQLCNVKKYLYVCPRCSIKYCSIECYKSTNHLECSEAFYRTCVEQEMQTQEVSPEMRQKTEDILQRIYNQDINDDILSEILKDNENANEEEVEELDSDDEDIPPLEKRLENINLDNAEELWSALSESERQEFEALIQSGEASQLLPTWKPWWNFTVEKKLIKDVEEEENKSYQYNCPKIIDLPELESTSKASPFLKYSIINVVYAYAYSVLYYNGEHNSTPLDAVCIFLRICDTMRINRIFKSSTYAIENVLLEITHCDALTADQNTIMETKEAGDAILNGPEEVNRTFYILAALSDLHQLFHTAKKEISTDISKMTSNFKSKFQTHIDLAPLKLNKKNFSLFIKKIEFYIAWMKSQSPAYKINEDENV